jgi:transketolase
MFMAFVIAASEVIGLHRVGMSGPGDQVMKEFGIDAAHVVDAAKSL